MMSPREQLVLVARRLGQLRGRAVFVGGATLELLITDSAAAPIRPTDDVDVVIPVTSRREFLDELSQQLRRAGFRHDVREGAPICRWIVDEVTVDVMPTQSDILGFANRWYEEGVRHAQQLEVEPGLQVNVFTAPYFVATKIEAFKDRGNRDFLASADLEDIVSVVDGRPQLLDEVANGPSELRDYLAREIAGLLADADFVDSLAAHLPPDRASQARVAIVHRRFATLASGLPGEKAQ